MAIDWLGFAKWLGPKALEAAKRAIATRDAADLQNSRDEHATAAGREVTRMVLSGYTTANVNLLNLIHEYEGFLDRGARVPRDLGTLVGQLVEKAREAQYREHRRDHGAGGQAHRYPAVKKASSRRAAAKRSAAKRPAAKKVSAKRTAAKRPAAKRSAAKKSLRA